MTIDVKIECEVPPVPSYLKTPAGAVPLCAVTDDALRVLGALWTSELIAKAKRMKADQLGTSTA